MGKKDYLIENGTYNKNHSKVKVERFSGSDFYDPLDMAQVKYEMLKEVEQKGVSITAATEDFGFSRTAYYSIRDSFDKRGISGLIPEKPGPRKPHKLTPEYQNLVNEWVAEDPKISSSELARRIGENYAIAVNKRTIERYRAKKKLN